MNAIRPVALVALWLLMTLMPTAAAPPAHVLDLWPGTAPGDTNTFGPERDMTKPSDHLVAGKPVIRLGNVTRPTLAVYPPPKDKANGTAVLVCPGGAYHILAYDLEGTEVCDWLNSLGITGVLLKYRVPQRPGETKYAAALQDAQRAMGLARQHAADWGFNPQRLGVLGFSAGGHLAAVLSSQYRHRTYPEIDGADSLSCRPDFTVLIYPAYLTVKDEGDCVAPEFNLTTNTPPTFMAATDDDTVRVETDLFYAAALHKAKVPFELHIYPSGGHGYGLRRTRDYITTWPQRVADWLRSQNLIP